MNKCKLGGNPLSRGWGKLFTKLSLSKVENCLSMGILGEASVHRSLPKPGSGKATLTPYRSWGQQKPIEKAQRNRDKDESAFYDVPSATSRQRPLLIKFNSVSSDKKKKCLKRPAPFSYSKKCIMNLALKRNRLLTGKKKSVKLSDSLFYYLGG